MMAKIIDKGILANDSSMIWTYGLWLLGLSAVSLVSGIINSYFSSHVAQSFVRKGIEETSIPFAFGSAVMKGNDCVYSICMIK